MTNQPREFSHPLLWTAGLAVAAVALTWVFGHWLGIGARAGRDLGVIKLAPAEAAKPVDHAALIADRGQAVLDRGRALFSKNCAACHGANGDENPLGSNPAPRNLKKDAFKAEWGGGPVGLYLTLTKGWGQGMPGFTNLEAADRYAVAHFIRESWVKGSERYVEQDPPAVLAQVQQPVAAAVAETGPRIRPELIDQPERLHPLMKAVGTDAAQRVAAAQAWIAAAIPTAEPAERRMLAQIAAAGARHPGWLLQLQQAAQDRDRARLAALLVSSDSGDPAVALFPAAGIDAITAALIPPAARD